MKAHYKPMYGKLIVKQLADTTKLANGMVVQEQRGKKDILQGMVILSHKDLDLVTPNKSKVYYPAYSSLHITLEGEQYEIVDIDDVILIEEVNQ